MSREKQLSCLYTLSNRGSRNYRRVTIDKKDGGSRTLLVPCGLLKGVQRNILHHVLDERPVSPCAQAYRKGTDIRGNASCHLGKKLVLKLDISHFLTASFFPGYTEPLFPKPCFPRRQRCFSQACAAAMRDCPRARPHPRPFPIW